jgi:hypothetical protein
MITKLRALSLPDDSVVPYLRMADSPFCNTRDENSSCMGMFLTSLGYTWPFYRGMKFNWPTKVC